MIAHENISEQLGLITGIVEMKVGKQNIKTGFVKQEIFMLVTGGRNKKATFIIRKRNTFGSHNSTYILRQMPITMRAVSQNRPHNTMT